MGSRALHVQEVLHVARRLLVIIGLLLASATGSWLVWPEIEYLPSGNRNLVFAIVMPPPGYNLQQMTQIGQSVEDHLRAYWDVDLDDAAQRNQEIPAIEDFFFVARGRSVFVGLRAADPQQVSKLLPLLRELGDVLPGMRVIANQSSLFSRGLGAGRGVEIDISGDDLPHLVELGGHVMRQLNRAMPGVQARPEPSLDLASPEVHVIPKPIQTASLQVDNQQLGYMVNALIDGAYVTDYFVGGRKIDITLIGHTDPDKEDDFYGRTQDMEVLPVATPGGQLVTLGDLADIHLSSGPEQINHRERQRSISINVSPPDDISLERALRIIEHDIVAPMRESGMLGDTTRISLSGSADKLLET